MSDQAAETLDKVRTAFANQVDYCRANGAPITGQIVAAVAAAIDADNDFARRLRNWPGNPLADGLPLRTAGAMHALAFSGAAPELFPIYGGVPRPAADVEALVAAAIERNVPALLPWLDGPPQTNEAGRSSNYIAALLWLAGRGFPATFDCLEIGSSAGINLMIDRYRYVLGGVGVGPADSGMQLFPEWRGPPPPHPPPGWGFARLKGCDVAPVDLRDPAQLQRLQAYVWPEHKERFGRLTFAAASARANPPDLIAQDADAFVEAELAREQVAGTTRVIMHSIVWQYLGPERQARITRAIEAAGAAATAERALAWIALEANRDNFKHELVVRAWPGDGEPHLLARAHAHGAWIEWLA